MAVPVALGPQKDAVAGRIRTTAGKVDADHPETVAGDHLRDAAKVLQHGSTNGAKRHLDAAMEVLTPRNLIRHGVTDDEGHATAKHHMHEINRHRLGVMDIEDSAAKNAQLRQAKAQQAAQDKQARQQAATDKALKAAAGKPGPGTRTIAPPPDPVPTTELATELRNRRGEWMGAGSAGALSHHRGYMTGRTAGGEQVAGMYNHVMRTVTPRNSKPVRITHVRTGHPVAHHAVTRPRLSLSSWDEVCRAIELAFAPMAFEHELRDPHTGKWTSGPVTLGNVREHLETTHGFGHSFPDKSNEWLIQHHNDLHRRLPFAQNHTHTVRVSGGGTGTPYGRMRAARDFIQAASSPGFTPAQRTTMGFSSWGAVCQAIELSARTAMLEATPAPRGRPGGPGLYHVKGLGHTDYLQQIVKALIEKRGMEPGKAYAIARGAIRKWMRGGGHVHPEVQAAAGRAEAGEVARQARAHAHAGDSPAIGLAYDPSEPRDLHGMWVGRRVRFSQKAGVRGSQMHGHVKSVSPGYGLRYDRLVIDGEDGRRYTRDASTVRIAEGEATHAATWDQLSGVIELVAGGPQWQQQQRVPPGQPGGGTFGANSKQPPGKRGSGKRPPGKPAGKSRAARRAALTAQISGLRRQLATTIAAYRIATGKSKSSTPKKKGAGATSAKAAAASKAKAKTATAKKSTTQSPAQMARTMSAASLHQRIVALRAQLAADLSRLRSGKY
jgi:hypothetical protein